jgi:hypothetical protein
VLARGIERGMKHTTPIDQWFVHAASLRAVLVEVGRKLPARVRRSHQRLQKRGIFIDQLRSRLVDGRDSGKESSVHRLICRIAGLMSRMNGCQGRY